LAAGGLGRAGFCGEGEKFFILFIYFFNVEYLAVEHLPEGEEEEEGYREGISVLPSTYPTGTWS